MGQVIDERLIGGRGESFMELGEHLGHLARQQGAAVEPQVGEDTRPPEAFRIGR